MIDNVSDGAHHSMAFRHWKFRAGRAFALGAWWRQPRRRRQHQLQQQRRQEVLESAALTPLFFFSVRFGEPCSVCLSLARAYIARSLPRWLSGWPAFLPAKSLAKGRSRAERSLALSLFFLFPSPVFLSFLLSFFLSSLFFGSTSFVLFLLTVSEQSVCQFLTIIHKSLSELSVIQ